ncbi:MAG: hypothetical protein HZB51_21770 [Chloroflexi bacterium]|nr:hypothetical protein [Chloroflexota bacterium]
MAIAIALLRFTVGITVAVSVGVTVMRDVGMGFTVLVFVGDGRPRLDVDVAVTVTREVGIGVGVLVFVGEARTGGAVLVAVGGLVFVTVGFAGAVRVRVGVFVDVARGACLTGVGDARDGVPVVFANELASVATLIGLVMRTTSNNTKPMAMTAIAKIARLL